MDSMLVGARRIFVVMLAWTILATAMAVPALAAPVAQDEPPLISRSVLFGNPDKVQVRMSDDGTKISYIAPVDGVLNVWVGPASDPSQAKPVTNDQLRGIRGYFWAETNQHIVYTQDTGGDENWRIYVVDLATGQTKDLTPIEGVNAGINSVSPKFPQEIVVGLNDRDPRYHDLYRINIVTGERKLLLQNPDFAGFLLDDDYKVRMASRSTADGGSEWLVPDGSGGWKHLLTVSLEDDTSTYFFSFDAGGKLVYMSDSRGRDTAALTSLNMETGEEKMIAESPKADLSQVMLHPVDRHVQAASFAYERDEWTILDQSIAPDMEYLRGLSSGDLQVASRTRDDRTWIVAYLSGDGPTRYYRYDRATRNAQYLFSHRESLEGLDLAEMTPVVIKARDGLDLVSYLTLPVGSNPEGGIQTDRPLPMVLLVHGGPWARDEWGYNPEHQLLANRGYAVLSVNYRGSTGFGKAFANAGNREWAGKMHDDLIDAVNWAVDQGIADPNKVAIMGGSYGGYATLVGLTFTPDVFACGVDIVGPSNLVTLMSTVPPYWEPVLNSFRQRIGDNSTEEGLAFLESRSPLTYADRIVKPLLIGQGANDPRVKQAEADQIVAAMQEKNIPVTYVLYPDEGHGFARDENNLSFYVVTEQFLAEQLGGRAEPIGADFEGSSITVPVGAEEIPSLAEALQK